MGGIHPDFLAEEDLKKILPDGKKRGVYGRGTEATSVRSARAFTFSIPWEIV